MGNAARSILTGLIRRRRWRFANVYAQVVESMPERAEWQPDFVGRKRPIADHAPVPASKAMP